MSCNLYFLRNLFNIYIWDRIHRDRINWDQIYRDRIYRSPSYSTPGTRFTTFFYHYPPPFRLQTIQKSLQLFPHFLNLPSYPLHLLF